MKNKILTECFKIALNNLIEHDESFKHYTFIVRRNLIIGHDSNRAASPLPFYPTYSKLHSEVNAYRKYRHDIGSEPFEVVNIRLSADGRLRNSMPCKCCLSFLNTLNCASIWFSTNIGFSKLC